LARIEGNISFFFPDESKIIDFQDSILSWYNRYGRYFPWRKDSATSYHRIIAEILLQRTKAETVAIFYSKFVRKYPSWSKLSKASEEELQEWFKSIGLWRQKASALHKLATIMAKRHGRFPKKRGDIEALPGIGQYIANAILLFCYGEKQPLLDANMARVLERFFGPRILVDIRYDPYLQSLSRKVIEGNHSISVNWGILDFARTICKNKSPECDVCPVVLNCRYNMGQTVPK